MKLGRVTKLDKKNKATSKKFNNNLMSGNCNVMVSFGVFFPISAVRRPDSGHGVCRNYVFSKNNLCSYKN